MPAAREVRFCMICGVTRCEFSPRILWTLSVCKRPRINSSKSDVCAITVSTVVFAEINPIPISGRDVMKTRNDIPSSLASRDSKSSLVSTDASSKASNANTISGELGRRVNTSKSSSALALLFPPSCFSYRVCM